MKLLWLEYRKNSISITPPKHFLALYIWNDDEKFHILDSSKISDRGVEQIKQNLDALQSMQGRKLTDWIKHHLPNTYRVAYRILATNKIKILKEYDITALIDKLQQ